MSGRLFDPMERISSSPSGPARCMAHNCSMRSTPPRPNARASRRSWARWAGKACSQAVKYALTMVTPFSGGDLFTLSSIFYKNFSPLSSTRNAATRGKTGT